MTLDPIAERYLRHLGIAPEPPSVELLFRIQQAHVDRLPWETLWIQQGRTWAIDPATSAARLGATGRGGYCFHLNGGLSELLRALGFDVTLHVGCVHGPDGPTPERHANHLVLTVAGLPTDDNPAGTWYVDAGLGDALYEPLPWRAGVYRQGLFQLELIESPDDEPGNWRLVHDPAGSFGGMTWHAAPAAITAFAEQHAHLSSSPESTFVRVLIMQRRHQDAVDMLYGLTLLRVGAGAAERELTSKAELFDAIGDVFGLDLSTDDPSERDALWGRVSAAQEAWREAQAAAAAPAD